MSGPLPSTPPSRDLGLQPERTSLAWLRTGLAATTASLVLVRVAVHRERGLIAALSAVLALVALGALLEGTLQAAARRRVFSVSIGEAVVDEDPHRPVRPARLPLLARATVVATIGLAVAGLLLVSTT